MPASSYAACAIDSLKVRSGSPPTVAASVERLGMSMTVLGNVGVTVEIALIRTGSVEAVLLRRTRCSRAPPRPPPSEVAQMSSRCSGSATTALASTSSALTSLR